MNLRKIINHKKHTGQSVFRLYKNNLRILQADGTSTEYSFKILTEIVNDSVHKAQIPKRDFIESLLDKTDRNYHAHYIIDYYIAGIMDNQPVENKHSIVLIVDGKDDPG